MKRQSEANPGIDLAHYTPEIIAMMDEAAACLKCGGQLKYAPDKSARRNRGYCCFEHYRSYPPKMAYIAQSYGKPARDVICELLNSGISHETAAGMLGISKPQLYEYIRKLGIKRVVTYV